MSWQKQQYFDKHASTFLVVGDEYLSVGKIVSKGKIGKGENRIKGEEQWNTGSTRAETKRKMMWNIGETVTVRRSVTVGREEDGETWLLWTVACGLWD
ncbi:hypothetical protein ACLOJK_007755 [Asimina triloba]